MGVYRIEGFKVFGWVVEMALALNEDIILSISFIKFSCALNICRKQLYLKLGF